MDVGFFINLNSSNPLLYPGIRNIGNEDKLQKRKLQFRY